MPKKIVFLSTALLAFASSSFAAEKAYMSVVAGGVGVSREEILKYAIELCQTSTTSEGYGPGKALVTAPYRPIYFKGLVPDATPYLDFRKANAPKGDAAAAAAVVGVGQTLNYLEGAQNVAITCERPGK